MLFSCKIGLFQQIFFRRRYSRQSVKADNVNKIFFNLSVAYPISVFFLSETTGQTSRVITRRCSSLDLIV